MSAMESSNIHVGRFISAPIEVEAEFPLGVMALPRNNLRFNSDLNSDPNDVDEDLVSNGESGASSFSMEEELRFFGDGLIRVEEEDEHHQFIKQKFFSGLVDRGLHTRVEAIHKNVFSSLTSQAKLHSFLIFSRVMERKNDGCANVKYAWFGGSKDEIRNIFKHGFGSKSGIFGHGIYLSPLEAPFASLQSSVVDKDGLRHLVLCRVILGRMEPVQPGSVQSCPSSEEFDSGVDSLSCPNKYVVWSTHANTHILPQSVISFRSPSNLNEVRNIAAPIKKPSSPWMPFPSLISELANFLPLNTIRLIKKHHADQQQKIITRQELIQKVRRIVGDGLLVRAIKSYRDKLETSRRLPPRHQTAT